MNGNPASIMTQAKASAFTSGLEVATAMATTSMAKTHAAGAVEAGEGRPWVGQAEKLQNKKSQVQDVTAVKFQMPIVQDLKSFRR